MSQSVRKFKSKHVTSRTGLVAAADKSLCPIRRGALEDHVAAVMCKDSGRFFSIGLPAGSLRSLKSVLAVSDFKGGAFDNVEAGVSGERPEIHSASVLAGSEHLCGRGKKLVRFTVDVAHISRAVRLKVSGQQSLSGVQVVAVHSLLLFRPADQLCVVNLAPMSSMALGKKAAETEVVMTMHPATLSSESLLSMYCWDTSPDMCLYFSSHCDVPDVFDDATPSVLRTLSVSPEGAPDESFVDSSSRNLLAYLRAEGFVVGPPWKLTLKGKENIACGAKIQEKFKVCQRAPDFTDLGDMTLYELLLELDAREFQEIAADTRVKLKEARNCPYEPPDSEKVWYTRPGQGCNRNYVEALLCAQPGRPVPHFARGDTYKALLGKNIVKKHPQRPVKLSGASGGPCPDDFEPPKKARAARKKSVNKESDPACDEDPESEVDDSSGESSQHLAPDDGSEGIGCF